MKVKIIDEFKNKDLMKNIHSFSLDTIENYLSNYADDSGTMLRPEDL